MHPEILQRQEKLQHLFKQAECLQKIDKVDGEIRAQFVWYLCIRTSGYVETSVKTILSEYMSSQTDSASIIDEQFRYSRGMKFREIAKLIGQFSPKWEKRLRDVTSEKLKRSLYSIVANRNSIAHGYDVALSLEELKRYFADAQQVVELVYATCDPPSAQTNDA